MVYSITIQHDTIIVAVSSRHVVTIPARFNGMILGLWNLIQIFVAYCNENPNWVSNAGHCGVTDSNRDRYGTDAYSCPYYS